MIGTLKKNTKAALVAVAIVGLFALPLGKASAQQASAPVQQNATHLDAATLYATSGATGGTLTFQPPGSLSFYLTAIDITNCAGASAVTAAGVTTVTTTNFGNSSTAGPIWTVGSGTTAGSCQPTISVSYPGGLKSNTPGLAATIVLPTFATNQTVRVNAYGYYAP
jgi:hypothetical protein